jgi:hypothetical protein
MNVVESEERQFKKEEEFRKYLMALIQPEVFKKLEEKEKAELFESKIDLNKENLSVEEMRRIAAEAEEINKRTISVERPEPAPLSEEWANPISLIEE